MSKPDEIQDPSTSQLLVAVIINPLHILSTIDFVEAEISSYLASRGCETKFYRTESTASVSNLTRNAINEGANLIIAAGGDGTVIEVINALIGIDIPLGIIPLGTGNLLALNLGLPTPINEALTVAVEGVDRWIDLVNVNQGQHYFAIMGGIGFDAKIMEETDKITKQRMGRIAYIWTALRNLEGDLFEANIQIDGGDSISVQAKSILIAKMGMLDPNINAFPNALPDNGTMQVGILKASNAAEFFRLFASAIVTGTPQNDPSFDIYTCKSLQIELAELQPFEYDGEHVGEITKLSAEIAPQAVRIRTARDIKTI